MRTFYAYWTHPTQGTLTAHIDADYEPDMQADYPYPSLIIAPLAGILFQMKANDNPAISYWDIMAEMEVEHTLPLEEY